MSFATWLVIEFCAPDISSMSEASKKVEDVSVLTVSESDDGTKPGTIGSVKRLASLRIRRGGRVFLWSSAPRTGGSPFQRLLVSMRGAAYRQGRLARHWALHRKLWRSFMELSQFVHGWAIEWPLRCAYWNWRQTQSFLRTRTYPLYSFTVDGCALGMRGRDGELILKRWRVITTHPKVEDCLSAFACNKQHQHSQNFNLPETQHYPEEMVTAFLQALRD